MSDSVQLRVLKYLADAETQDMQRVARGASCTIGELQQIARAGFVRIPDISRGGHLVCITPKGVEHLQRANRARYEEYWPSSGA